MFYAFQTAYDLIGIVCSFFFSSRLQKNKNTGPVGNNSFTAKMGGIRKWVGSYHYKADGPQFNPAVDRYRVYPDTTFEVKVIDDTTIVFPMVPIWYDTVLTFTSQAFKYHQSDSIRQIHFFGDAYWYYSYGQGQGGGVAYYYAKDSIVYCRGDRHGTTDSWELDEVYYTH